MKNPDATTTDKTPHAPCAPRVTELTWSQILEEKQKLQHRLDLLSHAVPSDFPADKFIEGRRSGLTTEQIVDQCRRQAESDAARK